MPCGIQSKTLALFDCAAHYFVSVLFIQAGRLVLYLEIGEIMCRFLWLFIFVRCTAYFIRAFCSFSFTLKVFCLLIFIFPPKGLSLLRERRGRCPSTPQPLPLGWRAF
jgi:hypothetical protein